MQGIEQVAAEDPVQGEGDRQDEQCKNDLPVPGKAGAPMRQPSCHQEKETHADPPQVVFDGEKILFAPGFEYDHDQSADPDEYQGQNDPLNPFSNRKTITFHGSPLFLCVKDRA